MRRQQRMKRIDPQAAPPGARALTAGRSLVIGPAQIGIGLGWAVYTALALAAMFTGAWGWWGVWTALFVTGATSVLVVFAWFATFIWLAGRFVRQKQR